MKSAVNLLKKIALLVLMGFFLSISFDGMAQHRPRGGGGNHKETPIKPKPSTNRTRPTTNSASGGTTNKVVRPNSGNSTKIDNKQVTNNRKPSTVNNNKVDNRNTNISGNKVNVDKSRNNVNINVNNNVNVRNNRNTVVVRNPRPYARPPYRYGGYRYNCYHPYYPRPYRPFYWGPVWHPWGFFVATLAVTAIVVSVESTQYHYDQGVWYSPSNGGYQAVPAPVGGTVNNIPSGAETVNTGTVNNYYYGGTYYQKEGSSYKVVAPTAGALVDNLPEGGEEVTVGDAKYVKFGETYYQPVKVDGKDKYEVVLVEEDK